MPRVGTTSVYPSGSNLSQSRLVIERKITTASASGSRIVVEGVESLKRNKILKVTSREERQGNARSGCTKSEIREGKELMNRSGEEV